MVNTDVVRPKAMSLPLPYFTPWTGEYRIFTEFAHILLSVCQEVQHIIYNFFFFLNTHKAKTVQTFLYIITFVILMMFEKCVENQILLD